MKFVITAQTGTGHTVTQLATSARMKRLWLKAFKTNGWQVVSVQARRYAGRTR